MPSSRKRNVVPHHERVQYAGVEDETEEEIEARRVSNLPKERKSFSDDDIVDLWKEVSFKTLTDKQAGLPVSKQDYDLAVKCASQIIALKDAGAPMDAPSLGIQLRLMEHEENRELDEEEEDGVDRVSDTVGDGEELPNVRRGDDEEQEMEVS